MHGTLWVFFIICGNEIWSKSFILFSRRNHETLDNILQETFHSSTSRVHFISQDFLFFILCNWKADKRVITLSNCFWYEFVSFVHQVLFNSFRKNPVVNKQNITIKCIFMNLLVQFLFNYFCSQIYLHRFFLCSHVLGRTEQGLEKDMTCSNRIFFKKVGSSFKFSF